MAVRVSVRDMERHKLEFDSVLAARDFSKVRACVVSLDRVPEILCAGALYPECDFDGRSIGDLRDLNRTPELVSFSLISTDTGGAFVFAWLESSDNPCRQLAASLERLPDSELPQAIARFIFEFCENHYLNPEWWDNADGNVRNALINRFATAASLYAPRTHESCLASDGVSAVSWKIIGRSWVYET